MQLNKEKMTKNTFFYQNLIVFSWTSVSLIFIFFKTKNTLKSLSLFIFITMVHTKKKKKSQLKSIQRNLQIMSS